MAYLKYDLEVSLNFHRNNDCVDECDYERIMDEKIKKAIRTAITDELSEYVTSDNEILTGFNIELDYKDRY